MSGRKYSITLFAPQPKKLLRAPSHASDLVTFSPSIQMRGVVDLHTIELEIAFL